jgi:hypothetical protein
MTVAAHGEYGEGTNCLRNAIIFCLGRPVLKEGIPQQENTLGSFSTGANYAPGLICGTIIQEIVWVESIAG